MDKIIVILGPTASGKTKMAARLARQFNGEIISADSRQVYRGLDVGSGKDLNEYSFYQKKKLISIPYHLIDVADPKRQFSIARYQKLAYRAIDQILAREKLPFVVGGSGLYLQTITDGYALSAVKPDYKLRAQLEKQEAGQILARVQKINPRFAQALNHSEQRNKRHLIRYCEILQAKLSRKSNEQKYCSLVLGIKIERTAIRDKIYKRLIERLEYENLVGEVENLHHYGVSWQRLIGFGLEYKFVSLYLRGDLTYNEMIARLNIAIGQFAKRQMTWFRHMAKQGTKINWISSQKQADDVISRWLISK